MEKKESVQEEEDPWVQYDLPEATPEATPSSLLPVKG